MPTAAASPRAKHGPNTSTLRCKMASRDEIQANWTSQPLLLEFPIDARYGAINFRLHHYWLKRRYLSHEDPILLFDH